MTFKKIGVVGAGTMGNGITQAFAVAGLDVVMMDVAEAAVQRGLATLSASLDRLIKKEKMTAEQKAETLARITTATAVAALSDCDLVIEAATENLELKLKIFAQLDATLKDDAVIASNTSSISITKLAASTKRAVSSSVIRSSDGCLRRHSMYSSKRAIGTSCMPSPSDPARPGASPSSRLSPASM